MKRVALLLQKKAEKNNSYSPADLARRGWTPNKENHFTELLQMSCNAGIFLSYVEEETLRVLTPSCGLSGASGETETT